MLYGYRVVNNFLNGTHVRSRVNLVHFKGAQFDLMKHTWWNLRTVPGTAYWNMGHTAGTSRKIGIYFILRSNWHIDVLWYISKIFYWISFFSVHHMVPILNCMIFCIVYYANCTYSKLVYLIGTYIVQGFDMKLWKLLSTALTFIWDPTSASMKLRMYQVIFFWLIQDFVHKFGNMHYFSF